MAGAEAKASKEYLAKVRHALLMVAGRGEPFSMNDVWESGLVERPNGDAIARAAGSVIAALHREGVIRKTSRVVRSKYGTAYIDVWEQC